MTNLRSLDAALSAVLNLQTTRRRPAMGFGRKVCGLAVQIEPDFAMENVLKRYKEGCVFRKFVSTLEGAGYSVEWTIAKCEEFGVPQSPQKACSHSRPSQGPLRLPPVERWFPRRWSPKLAAGDGPERQTACRQFAVRIELQEDQGVQTGWNMARLATAQHDLRAERLIQVIKNDAIPDHDHAMRRVSGTRSRTGPSLYVKRPSSNHFLQIINSCPSRNHRRSNSAAGAVPVKLGEAIGKQIVQIRQRVSV